MMRRFVTTRAALLVGAAILLGALAGACDRKPEHPPIVLITIDTLRADHLGTYGYFRNTSPNLDRFAEDAVVFEKVVTTMASTLPAHVSLMTSTFTTTHGLKGNFEFIARPFEGNHGLRTFAEMLSDHGYTTAAFVSATPVKKGTGIERGFAKFDEPHGKQRSAQATTDAVLLWLQSGVQAPFLLWVHYFDPHVPYEPPRAFRDRMGAEMDGLEDFLASRNIPFTDELRKDHNRYDGEILFVDSQIERLFESLKKLEQWDDATVVVTADHGEGLGQHGWHGHGEIHNEQLLVPLMIKFSADAGVPAQRVSSLASTIDVLPTLAGTLRLPLARADLDRFEGSDLLRRDPKRERSVVAERTLHDRGWGHVRKIALLNESWKYVHLSEGDDALYDLVHDQYETRDVLHENDPVAQKMKAQIREILSREPPIVDWDKEIPEQRRRELEALGYVQ